ncbi:MAG: hypothetical protein WBM00_02930 [Solirubrobacterales bacterium]
MRLHLKVVLIVGVLSLAAAPAIAAGNKPANVPPTEPGASGHSGPNYNPSPPSPPSQAKAYGLHCQGESKQHVDGKKWTPFAECVLAMARAAHNKNLSPREACQGLSKKHVKGKKRTPFAECVVGAAQLRHDEEQAASS